MNPIGENLYSQLGEERIIRAFFNDMRGGFYVDIGAAWGDKVSTSLYLDKELGWRGIGVDALEFYGKTWAETRPDSTFLNYAVTERSGDTIDFYHAVIPTLSTMYPRMLERWKLSADRSKHRRVTTISLDDLLEQQGVSHIDFLSIDTEGSEPGVLRGFTLARYRPKLVCIEAVADEGNNGFILEYFKSGGYVRIEECDSLDSINWYFHHHSSGFRPNLL
ncbi:MAG: FkbM family methyltransferase [Halieaceae bacterium]|jgi:FkbM family methyltransferase|nr:FkbM family methyltransferase [Halieaceae bacterium]